jgi:hypothetical protein
MPAWGPFAGCLHGPGRLFRLRHRRSGAVASDRQHSCARPPVASVSFRRDNMARRAVGLARTCRSARPATTATCCGCCGLGGPPCDSGAGGPFSTAERRLDRAQPRHGAAGVLMRTPDGTARTVKAGLRMPRHPRPVHPRTDAVGAAMRWVERRLLARCDLLILSSPGFLDAYFRPVQRIGDAGRAAGEQALGLGAPAPADRPRDGTPMRPSSWAGSVRCAAREPRRSSPVTARALGPAVEIVCHGAVHRHAIAGVRRHPGGASEHPPRGSYRYPDDLSAIYDRLR